MYIYASIYTHIYSQIKTEAKPFTYNWKYKNLSAARKAATVWVVREGA